MKRRKRLAGRISRSVSGLTAQSGSIVVEAAIVMPIILLALTAFATIISLCAAQMALQSAATQSVRHIAAHIYPVELARQQLNATTDAPPVGEEAVSLPAWADIAADAAEWLPDPAGELISATLRGDWMPLQNAAAAELGRGVIEPYVHQFVNRYLLKPDRVRLDRITLPDLESKQAPYLGIALTYEYPIKIPFTGKPVVLREQSLERVWVNDAVAANYGSGEDEQSGLALEIVSISPVPVRPGLKATVVVRTEPGAAVSLSVMYKSGASKARHLGDARADENGLAQWTWHVSGNTTPGIWQFTVAAINVDASVSEYFAVEKRSS